MIQISIIAIIWAGIFTIWFYQNQHIAKIVNQTLNTTRPIAKTLEAQKQRLKEIQSLLEERSLSLSSLKIFYDQAGSDIYLKSLEYSKDANHHIEIEGIAKTLASAFNYLGHLKQTGMFSQVEIKNTQLKKAKQGDVIFFELVVRTK